MGGVFAALRRQAGADQGAVDFFVQGDQRVGPLDPGP